jgi:hypothetical protein
MEDLLRSKGLYQITLGKETTPTDVDKKFIWDNRNDEACVLSLKNRLQHCTQMVKENINANNN